MTSVKRIEYIDALRGLCIFWVVWYHSSHPMWVEYPFRMPTLFFVSGIFYKHYPWSIFWRKKINQYVVPFIFFYLLYYIFLVSINFLKYHYIPLEISTSFFDFVHMYSGNEGYVVNYPLWFMVALLVLQTITYTITTISKSIVLLVVFSVIMTLVGYLWLWHIPLPCFIGKALTFYIYYTVGYVFGKKIVESLENRGSGWRIMIISLFPFTIAVLMERALSHYEYMTALFRYVQFLILPIIMLCLFKRLSSLTILMKVFLFFGSNSLIIFGLHDMYLSILRIFLKCYCDVETPVAGMLMVILTLLLCFPSIKLLKRWVPMLVGKTPLLKLERQIPT